MMQCKARVLIVDDSSTIRALMNTVLAKEPTITVVATAANAEDAERILRSTPIDVVTLDVEMPGLNGLDYLPRLTARHNVSVIMLSSSTVDGSQVRALALAGGAMGCFSKADTVRELPELLSLIRAAANHKGRLSRKEAEALAHAKR